MSHTSRLAYLLSEMRRQMNGAVVGSMRFYGADYGLNYGVSIPTIRSVAKQEAAQETTPAANHKFAKLLFAQEVRELRLAAVWFADPATTAQTLDGWREGIINSEVAEEYAFALMSRVPNIDKWLDEPEELLRYCAVMAIAKEFERSSTAQIDQRLTQIWPRVVAIVEQNTKLIPKAVVAMLDTANRHNAEISPLLKSIDNRYITEEMTWRMCD